MRIGAALAVALLVVAAGCSHGHRSPTAAFGDLIKDRYGEQDGFWHCARDYVKTRLDCYAEVHRGNRYRSVFATTPAPPAKPRFSRVSTSSWDRFWRTLPTSPPRSSLPVPSLVRINTPVTAFDWGWLISGAQSDFDRLALPRSEVAVDGGTAGMPHSIFWFRCSAHGRLLTCRNKLGDELRVTFTAAAGAGRG